MVVASYLLCLFYGLFPGCPVTYHPSSVPLCPKGVVVLSSVSASHSGSQYPPSSKTKNRQSQIIHKMCVFLLEEQHLIPVMAKINFEQPLLQSSMSHDPKEIILIC